MNSSSSERKNKEKKIVEHFSTGPIIGIVVFLLIAALAYYFLVIKGKGKEMMGDGEGDDE